MSVKTTGMKPEEMKRNLWVIYRSLPNGMNEEEYFLTHEMEYKPAEFKVRSDSIPFEF